MSLTLTELSGGLRKRLIAALESGQLRLPCSVTDVLAVVGGAARAPELAAALNEQAARGVNARGLAFGLRLLDEQAGRQRSPDLVYSGPDPEGIYGRDARQVWREVVGNAERSLWISSYVYYNGGLVFKELAERMDEQPELEVTLLLNLMKDRNDGLLPDQHVARFAEKLRKQWPGRRGPRVYYDRHALEDGDGHGVLHAKCVVVDEQVLYLTSANLTEAAVERNIELGVILHERLQARSVVEYFRQLINQGRLKKLEWRSRSG